MCGLKTLQKSADTDDSLAYVKVHAPWSVLAKQAEILQLRMPIHVSEPRKPSSTTSRLLNFLNRCCNFVQPAYTNTTRDYYRAPFTLARHEQ
jgi:hypothetical protein